MLFATFVSSRLWLIHDKGFSQSFESSQTKNPGDPECDLHLDDVRDPPRDADAYTSKPEQTQTPTTSISEFMRPLRSIKGTLHKRAARLFPMCSKWSQMRVWTIATEG